MDAGARRRATAGGQRGDFNAGRRPILWRDHVIFLGAVEAIRTTGRNRVVRARRLRPVCPPIMSLRESHEQEAAAQARSREAEAAFPDDRRREFVAKATEFFSEEGFGGGPAIWRAGSA